ncbi:hypothetical protein Ava_D0031 [Trichormus variabilis ATCC 29413]|uniref:Uncharacterized protein n=2 Tax=Anabaena variabilis TaxID=264691 RepID=Q3M2U0_TRIV2|nr:hypothetical protein [Trichormus variabilis]ABA24696.1 hypothetical protein Ava_D0031 [Trichormus variabilis ATCC 29413]MBC1217734.1 hypothetical protein [Trichormus variabilis ARAD]MBC1258975.1 hypothetical protein [Trichormus variabilis V5]MBC1302686.1 hypothetical protein [Trichormus variabilis N2B]MBC1324541.1 hypothetical protein [Trichormus variabilis 9RC]
MRTVTTQINTITNIFLASVAATSLWSTGFFGIGAIGSLGAEIFTTNEYWRRQKDLFTGAALVSLSILLGTGFTKGTLTLFGITDEDE